MLAAGFARLEAKSEKRGLNPQPLPWQGSTLPLSYFRTPLVVGVDRGSHSSPREPEATAGNRGCPEDPP